MAKKSKRVLRPNPGPQEDFLASSADITIYGGAAGGGKTWALLYDLMRGVDDPHFRAVVLRRKVPNITNQGGLWDESRQMYPLFHGVSKSSPRLEWTFPSGAKVGFTHLQHEDTVYDHKGAQYTAICFDELTEFEESQFWYMFTRARSPGSRFRPWVRATTNPDATSWVAKLLDWWIDESGYAIPERSGMLRYCRREGDALVWVEPDELDQDGNPPISITFIPATLDDNPELLKVDPTYRARLRIQGKVEAARLADGNWKVSNRDGLFKHHRVGEKTIYPGQLPAGLSWWRYWDLADTEPHEKNPDPDWTASVKGALHTGDQGDTLYLADATFDRLEGARKREMMRRVAEDDGVDVSIGIEQEPGSSGKEIARDYRLNYLSGYHVKSDRPTSSKSVRASRWLPLAEEARVVVVLDEDGRVPWWVDVLVSQLDHFPDKPRDLVDGVSGVYAMCKDGSVWSTF